SAGTLCWTMASVTTQLSDCLLPAARTRTKMRRFRPCAARGYRLRIVFLTTIATLSAHALGLRMLLETSALSSAAALASTTTTWRRTDGLRHSRQSMAARIYRARSLIRTITVLTRFNSVRPRNTILETIGCSRLSSNITVEYINIGVTNM